MLEFERSVFGGKLEHVIRRLLINQGKHMIAIFLQFFVISLLIEGSILFAEKHQG
jgi:hypothetical protein